MQNPNNPVFTASLSEALIDDAFLHLSARLPQELSEKDRAYLQALRDFRRHLLTTLRLDGEMKARGTKIN